MAISPQRLTIYLFSAHRAVIFAIAQLSCTLNHSKHCKQMTIIFSLLEILLLSVVHCFIVILYNDVISDVIRNTN